MRRLVLAIVIIGALVGVSYLSYGRTAAPRAATVAGEQIPVVRGDIGTTVSATGSVEPARELALTFGGSGTLLEVAVEEGEQVEEGDVLARQETADLEFAVDQAEATLASAEAQLRQIEAPSNADDVASAEAQLASVEENLERVKAGPNEADIIAAQQQLSSTLASLERVQAGPSQADIEAAQSQLASAQANLQRVQSGSNASDIEAARQQLNSAQANLQRVL
ncbi:MAG TPA: biotin/lipoyl-binding protein, partial [Ardenticatenaceae bacterium]|nr:biotin/lipoyl-binding protein [Ardenticatenaceae bacterium]